MSNKVEYKDIIAFHPGYYISDIIEEMGITQSEFAMRLDTTEKTLSKLVNAEANISCDLAKKLSMMLGTSTDVWLNLQAKYDEKVIEIEGKKETDETKRLLSFIPYTYFEKNFNLKKTKSYEEKNKELCSFLKISNLHVLERKDFLINFRTSNGTICEKNIINSRIWLQAAISLSQNHSVESFDVKKLESFLPEIRSMTLTTPDYFLERLKKIFSSCGVVFLFLPYLKDSKINGAVKWINNKKAILALNNKGKSLDIFWFSLFHEIKHLLQCKIKKTFISSDINLVKDYDNKLEEEADSFAENYLIPNREYKCIINNGNLDEETILDFASSISINPAIVFGRLQKDKIIPYSFGKKYKESNLPEFFI